jgi:hypothetical protein
MDRADRQKQVAERIRRAREELARTVGTTEKEEEMPERPSLEGYTVRYVELPN